MPIDRPRRNALALLLEKLLRGQCPLDDFYAQSNELLDPNHLEPIPPHEGGPGFPVLPEPPPRPFIHDMLFDVHFARSLDSRPRALFSNKRSRQEKAFNDLLNTLRFLHSSLDEPDLPPCEEPKPSRWKRPLILILGFGSFLPLVACALAYPLLLLLWPAIGIAAFYKVITYTSQQNLESRNFLNNIPAPPDFTPPPFQPDLFPPLPPSPGRWKTYLLAPIYIIAVIPFVVALLAIAILFWPLTLADKLSPAQTPSERKHEKQEK